jgi:hypothetical protein
VAAGGAHHWLQRRVRAYRSEEASRFVLLQKPYSTEALALLLQKVVKSRLTLTAQG